MRSTSGVSRVAEPPATRSAGLLAAGASVSFVGLASPSRASADARPSQRAMGGQRAAPWQNDCATGTGA
eukprot:11224877-Lingulodinium_polyedra.AAC.1